MNVVSLNRKSIDFFLSLFSRIDNDSKKKLIIKLTESIDRPVKKKPHWRKLYGSWDDMRTSDEIINEILESRVDKQDKFEF